MFLKRRSILDELCSLLYLTKCWQKKGYRQARSQAMTCQRESVVIMVDYVQLNWNNIIYLFWFCSQVEMLTAKADFPTSGDPLIQIILWLPVFLTLVSITCKMLLQVPSIHGLHILSLFPPRVLTKLSSSFCLATVATMAADTMNQTTWTMNIGIETRPCST